MAYRKPGLTIGPATSALPRRSTLAGRRELGNSTLMPPPTPEVRMMSTFVVHTVPGSPAARAVMATLIEKGASFRVTGLAPGELKAEPHISRHPFGKMPVLEHDDFTLYETQAILRYLERALPSPPLIPQEPTDAARMDQIMGISDWYLFQGVNNVIGFHRIVGPRLMGLTPMRLRFPRQCLAHMSYLGNCLVCLARRPTLSLSGWLLPT